MATLEEADHTAVNGSVKELSTQEDAAGEQPYQTPDRRHVDALLDISEEDFLKELEPYEYHCYSGWEEAVRGWARVAPLSGILLTQKRYREQKHKGSDDLAPLSTDPAIPNADSYASTVEHRCESNVGPHNSFKKSILLNQHMESWSKMAVAALRKDASETPVLNTMQKTPSNISRDKKTKEEGTLRETPLQYRTTKSQKQIQRPSNKVVPIKNFTFFPPINSPHLNPQSISGVLCSGKKAPEGGTMEENCLLFDRRTERMRGTRVDPVANPELPTYSAGLTSKYPTCQRSPHLFSAVSISIPKRYQVPTSSKHEAAHHTGFSVGKRLTHALHAGPPAGAQARLRPSKTVCAVKLYEGCGINV